MTLRTYISKRAWSFAIPCLAAWLVFGASFVSGLQRDASSISFVALISLAVAVFTAIGLLVFVRCPRCHYKLGQLALTVTKMPLLSPMRIVNFCPHCGICFDEPT
jgi:hypothetical protein